MPLLLLLTLTLKTVHASHVLDMDHTSPWLKISHNVAFQRSPYLRNEDNSKIDSAANEAINRFLGGSKKSKSKTTFGVSPYENGMLNSGTEWSSYQLAWRLLGYYVDCNESEGNNMDRKLKDGNNKDGGNGGCTRYVMYAVVSDWRF